MVFKDYKYVFRLVILLTSAWLFVWMYTRYFYTFVVIWFVVLEHCYRPNVQKYGVVFLVIAINCSNPLISNVLRNVPFAVLPS